MSENVHLNVSRDTCISEKWRGVCVCGGGEV
jgi:hypothetical protein